MAYAPGLGVLYPHRRRFVADQPSDQYQGVADRRADEANMRIAS